MRLLNWDVLLFPEDSRIPIQEFDVKCQALPQSSASASNRLLALAGSNYQNSLTHVPTLTCFVSSLDEGRPFRVSIHSWERPHPSDLLQSFKPAPDKIIFEAKLYIDGKLKAQRHLGEQNTWPEIIDTMTSSGYSKPLRFPAFHAEILQQSHWDAGDSLGRIRILIAEGVVHSGGFAEGRTFDKLREVAAFSFQHAPKHILEYSGIAWPNARMFATAMQNVRNSNFDAHAHSPRQLGTQMAQKDKPHAGVTSVSLPVAVPLSGSKWASASTKDGVAVEDPFVGPSHKSRLQTQRRTNADTSMKDVSASSKNVSEMSGIEMEQPSLEQHLNQANVTEILGVLTPSKRESLFNALLPLNQGTVRESACNTPKSLSTHPAQSEDVSNIIVRPQSVILNTRGQCSAESQRSTSGNMSWEETPALGDLWSSTSNDYPNLLPTLQSSSSRHRSDSVQSKRKRSLSPRACRPQGSDLRSNTKGMSTSPCKIMSTPLKTDDKQATSKATTNMDK